MDGQGRSRRLNAAGGRIAYRFHARDLHLILGPAASGTSVRFRVFLDRQPQVPPEARTSMAVLTAPWPSNVSISWFGNLDPSTSAV